MFITLTQGHLTIILILLATLYFSQASFVLLKEYRHNHNNLNISSFIWVLLSLIIPLVIPIVYIILVKKNYK